MAGLQAKAAGQCLTVGACRACLLAAELRLAQTCNHLVMRCHADWGVLFGAVPSTQGASSGSTFEGARICVRLECVFHYHARQGWRCRCYRTRDLGMVLHGASCHARQHCRVCSWNTCTRALHRCEASLLTSNRGRTRYGLHRFWHLVVAV